MSNNGANRWETLEGDQAYYRIPSFPVEAMMTATRRAKQGRDGAITLGYLGGDEESRLVADQPDIDDFESYLNIVSWVQAGREA